MICRPELVAQNPVPLCSDAFSSFLMDTENNYEQDIKDATNRLETVIVPQHAHTKQQIEVA